LKFEGRRLVGGITIHLDRSAKRVGGGSEASRDRCKTALEDENGREWSESFRRFEDCNELL